MKGFFLGGGIFGLKDDNNEKVGVNYGSSWG
jgi:hypothetical protein